MAKKLTTLAITRYLIDSYAGDPVDYDKQCIFCGDVGVHGPDCPWPEMFREYQDALESSYDQACQ